MAPKNRNKTTTSLNNLPKSTQLSKKQPQVPLTSDSDSDISDIEDDDVLYDDDGTFEGDFDMTHGYYEGDMYEGEIDNNDDDFEEDYIVDNESVSPKVSSKKSLADLLSGDFSTRKKIEVVDTDSDSDSDVEEVSVSSLKETARRREDEIKKEQMLSRTERKNRARKSLEESQEHVSNKKRKLDIDVGEEDMLDLSLLEEAEEDESLKQEEILRKKNMGMLLKDQVVQNISKKFVIDELPKKKRVINVAKKKVYKKDGFTIAVNPFKKDTRSQMIDMAQSYVANDIIDNRNLQGTMKRVSSMKTNHGIKQPAMNFNLVKGSNPLIKRQRQ